MKLTLLLVMCHLSLSLFCQSTTRQPWTIECGETTNDVFKTSSSINLRYISPRFKWSNYELTEEEEKHPEKFRNARLMFELIYTPPLKVLFTGFNLQFRVLKYKRLNVEAYGGMKFILAAPPNFLVNSKLNKQGWYFNTGLLCQLDFGILAPFADIGGDSMITIGTELNLHYIHRKPKKRYKLHQRAIN